MNTTLSRFSALVVALLLVHGGSAHAGNAHPQRVVYEFVLDVSGSMAECGWGDVGLVCVGDTRFDLARKAISGFLRQCFPDDVTFGLRVFPGAAHGTGGPEETTKLLVDPLEGTPREVLRALQELDVVDNGTTLPHALAAARADLRRAGDARTHLLLVTDGEPNVPLSIRTVAANPGRDDVAAALEESCTESRALRRAGVAVDAIGLGEVARRGRSGYQNILRIVSECGGGHYCVVEGAGNDIPFFVFGRDGFFWLLLFTFTGIAAAWFLAGFLEQFLARKRVVPLVWVPWVCQAVFGGLVALAVLGFLAGRQASGVGLLVATLVMVVALVLARGLLSPRSIRHA